MRPKVLISGGSKGIGREIALYLSDSYDVHTFSREDVSDSLDHPNAPRIKHFGGIDTRDKNQLGELPFVEYDCIVNNVGVAYDGILATQDMESIEYLIEVNLTSAIFLTKMFLRARLAARKPGIIVNISSIVGVRGYSGLAVYSATKAGLDGLTRSLAREMGPKGFRINSVLPGYVDTDLTKDLTDDQRKQIIRRTPLGRLATVKDISPVVEFLLSDRARFVTGQSIIVDGGLSS